MIFLLFIDNRTGEKAKRMGGIRASESRLGCFNGQVVSPSMTAVEILRPVVGWLT